jgi:hypothetical protein
LSNDNDPKFLAEFYKNLKILSQDLYKKSVSTASGSAGGATPGFIKPLPAIGGFGLPDQSVRTTPNSKAVKMRSSSMKGADMQAIIAGAVSDAEAMSAGGSNAGFSHPADYFTAESLQERMKMYVQQGGIPMDYLERYTAGKMTSSHASTKEVN